MRLAPSRALSLHTVLALLPLVAVLPMVLFALFLLNRVWEEGRANAEKDLRQLLQIQTLALERELESYQRQLRLLSDAQLQQGLNPGAFRADAYRVLGYNRAWASITLTDAQGRLLAHSDDGIDGEIDNVMLAEYAHVQNALNTGFPVHSDGLKNLRKGHFRVGVALPFLSERTIVGVIHAELRPDALTAMLTPQHDRVRFVTILDSEYRVLTRSPEPERYRGQSIGEYRKALIVAQPDRGSAQDDNLGGRTHRVIWQQASNGWTVVVGEDLSVYADPLRRSLAMLLVVGLALLLLGVVSSRLAGRFLARQLDSLKQDAHRMAAGEALDVHHGRISEVQDLKRALRQAADRLQQAQAGRERAIIALRQADQRKDEFLSILAHELRNPMGPLRNALALLQERTRDDEPSQRMLALADRQLGLLIRLVDDLLDMARISRGRLDLQREPLVLQEVLQEAVDVLLPRLAARGQSLQMTLPEAVVVLNADRVRLIQIFENLLSNASKYSNEGQAIELNVQLDFNRVQVSITDQGIGLQPDELDQIFEIYRQVAGTVDRSQGGLGIGLALVHRLVMLHGGTVAAFSEGPGRGSRFEVRLPL